jgi:hypothetical protein
MVRSLNPASTSVTTGIFEPAVEDSPPSSPKRKPLSRPGPELGRRLDLRNGDEELGGDD